MSEELVGTVTHYFAWPQVGIVKLSAAIKLGDTLHFRGHTADFQQEVASMEEVASVEIEPAHVEAAASGAELGIKVQERVREGDQVYRVIP